MDYNKGKIITKTRLPKKLSMLHPRLTIRPKEITLQKGSGSHPLS